MKFGRILNIGNGSGLATYCEGNLASNVFQWKPQDHTEEVTDTQ